MLVGLCRAVFRAFGQTVFLVPNDVRAQVPTALPKRERKHPRYADHIFRLYSTPRFRNFVDAARIIEQKDLTEEKLNNTVNEILSQDGIAEKMGENAKKVIVKDVDKKIYDCIKAK